MKPLTDALARVQVGTDKTAAELAIRRYLDDITELKSRLEQRRHMYTEYERGELSRYDAKVKNSVSPQHFLILRAIMAAIAGGVTNSLGVGLVAGLLVFIAGLVLQAVNQSRMKQDTDRRIDDAKETMQNDVDALSRQVTDLQQKIEEKRRVADA